MGRHQRVNVVIGLYATEKRMFVTSASGVLCCNLGLQSQLEFCNTLCLHWVSCILLSVPQARAWLQPEQLKMCMRLSLPDWTHACPDSRQSQLPCRATLQSQILSGSSVLYCNRGLQSQLEFCHTLSL